MSYIVGVDLGQANDYTAVIVVQRHEPQPPATAPTLDVRYIHRYALGTPYPTIVGSVVDLVRRPPLHGATRLVVDATGVGRPIVDLLRGAYRGPLIPVTITAGGAPTRAPDGYWHLAKRDLIGGVQALLQSGRLRLSSGLAETPLLIAELQTYQVKISDAGHDSYNAREGKHDDLVLALALACWLGQQRGPRATPIGADERPGWRPLT